MNAVHVSAERPDFAKIDNRAPSVARMFLDRVAATPDAEAFRYPQDHTWESVTWRQVGDRVCNIAAGLIALGIAPEDRVALASSTRYEWVLIDFAVMCAGAATTTVYPTTNDSDTAYILANSGSRVVVAENQTQLDKLLAHRAELPDVGKVVMIDGNGDGDWVITLNELEQLGKQLLTDSPDAVTKRVAAVGPGQLASLIYTSGTTGRPKGVRLTHGAWTYTAAAIDALGILGPDDLNFLWLPLAHAFGKVMLGAAAADRVPHRYRWPGRADRRQPRDIASHHHGRCATHIRESPRARSEDGRRAGPAPQEDVRLVDRGRHESLGRAPSGEEAVVGVVAGVQGGGPLGPFYYQAAIRWTIAVLRIRGRRPRP